MTMSMRRWTGRSPRVKSGKLMVKSQKRPKKLRLRSKNRRVRESQGTTKLLAKQKR